jgi:transglutaminase-like putative cysteine protease
MMQRLPPLTRDKADTLLLLAASLLVLAPHAAHLPVWVSLLCAATLGCRAAVTLLGRRMPPSLLLLPVAGLAMAGVLHTYHTLLGRDAGVAMLVLLVAFKMLEMHARRDLYVVVFLCLFLALTNFFYSQSIGTALVMLLSVGALLATLISFQFTGKVPPLRTRLLLGARMLAFAAPLAAALFLVFPRVQGPLWGMPSDAAGHSGLSDKMAPGQLSHLAQSEDIAFRVRFAGPPPAQSELYWRGPVLGLFDGTTWTRVPPREQGGHARTPLSLSVHGRPVRYQVTLEPSDTRWLFALEMPEQLPDISQNLSFISSEFELTTAYPIGTRVRYDLSSYLSFNMQGAAGHERMEAWLQLPPGRNPRARAAGEQLLAEPDPAKRAQAVLRQFGREQFVYTLDPPLLLGEHSVDEFLYATRAGFCEHFSGAFVFLMRAAGVPARVVTGYQGGELNPVDGYVTVRQSDAHAWAEVWLGRRGWVRVDPTAAVAPERVRHGLAQALPPRPPFGIAGLGRLMGLAGERDSLLARLRFTLGAVNNGWHQWVLNYTPERQRGLLDWLQSALRGWHGAALVSLGCALWYSLRLLRKLRGRDPVDALYSALCRRLGELGFPRAPHEGPSAYAARIGKAGLAPRQAAAAVEFLACYSAWRYARVRPGAAVKATLKRLLSQLS